LKDKNPIPNSKSNKSQKSKSKKLEVRGGKWESENKKLLNPTSHLPLLTSHF